MAEKLKEKLVLKNLPASEMGSFPQQLLLVLSGLAMFFRQMCRVLCSCCLKLKIDYTDFKVSFATLV